MLWIGEPVGSGGPIAVSHRHRGRSTGRHQPGGPRPERRHHGARRVRGRRPAPRARIPISRSCASGPGAAGHVDIRQSPTENVRAIAAALRRDVRDITIVILERPRHEALIEEVRVAGARIKLITDGDLSAAISCAVSGTGVHARPGHRRGARRRHHGRGAQVPRRRDPGPVPVPQRRGAGPRRADGRHHGRGARVHDRGPGTGRGPRVRGDRRHQRRPARGRAVSSAAAPARTPWSWPTGPRRSASWTRSTCSTGPGRRRSACSAAAGRGAVGQPTTSAMAKPS